MIEYINAHVGIWPCPFGTCRTLLAPPAGAGYSSSVVEPKINSCWRKARIAARLLLKKEARRPWNARDHALAAQFACDDGVTNRLIDQAVKYLKAPL